MRGRCCVAGGLGVFRDGRGGGSPSRSPQGAVKHGCLSVCRCAGAETAGRESRWSRRSLGSTPGYPALAWRRRLWLLLWLRESPARRPRLPSSSSPPPLPPPYATLYRICSSPCRYFNARKSQHSQPRDGSCLTLAVRGVPWSAGKTSDQAA